MNKHMLFQIGLLCKMLIALRTDKILMLLMNLKDMSIQGIFGAKDEFAFSAMQGHRTFMDLLYMLFQ